MLIGYEDFGVLLSDYNADRGDTLQISVVQMVDLLRKLSPSQLRWKSSPRYTSLARSLLTISSGVPERMMLPWNMR